VHTLGRTRSVLRDAAFLRLSAGSSTTARAQP
jgi:hypothetical protein